MTTYVYCSACCLFFKITMLKPALSLFLSRLEILGAVLLRSERHLLLHSTHTALLKNFISTFQTEKFK